MSLFRDESPILNVNAAVDDSVALTSATFTPQQVAIPSKLSGAWAESFSPLAAANTSFATFVAPYAVRVLAVYARFGVTSSSGTLKLEDTPSGTAVGSGTALMSATMSLSGTANTNVNGTSSLIAAPIVPAGDSLSIILAGTLTGLANCVVTIILQKV